MSCYTKYKLLTINELRSQIKMRINVMINIDFVSPLLLSRFVVKCSNPS